MGIEMSKTKKFWFSVACFLTAIAVMGEMGVMPFVYDIYGAFPDNPTAVNYIVSGGPLWMVIGCFACTPLMRKFRKKSLLLFGVTIFCLGAIPNGFVTSLVLLMVGRSFMGIGEGVVNTVIMALIAEIFVDEEKRASFMGYWNAAATVFSTIMSAVSGVLATGGWQHGFWIYIPGILMVIAVALFIPNVDVMKTMLEEEPVKKAAEAKAPADKKPGFGKLYWFFILDYCLFTLAYAVQSYYISAYVAEAGIGDAAMAGFCTSASTIGSFVICLFFGKIYGKLRKSTTTYVFIVQAACMIAMYFVRTSFMAYLGSILIGASYGTYFTFSYAYVPEIVPAERVDDGIAYTTGFYGLAFFVCVYIFSFVQKLAGCEGVYTPLYLIFGVFSILPLVIEILTTRTYRKMFGK